jgi:hypothetical protein
LSSGTSPDVIFPKSKEAYARVREAWVEGPDRLLVAGGKGTGVRGARGRRLHRRATESPTWSAQVVVGLRTGLRSRELLALRWEDVDLHAGRLLVRRSVWQGVESTPKGGGPREIRLSDQALGPWQHESVAVLGDITSTAAVTPGYQQAVTGWGRATTERSFTEQQ